MHFFFKPYKNIINREIVGKKLIRYSISMLFLLCAFSCSLKHTEKATSKEKHSTDTEKVILPSEAGPLQPDNHFCTETPKTEGTCHPLINLPKNEKYEQKADTYTSMNFDAWNLPPPQHCNPTPQCCFIYCACTHDVPYIMRLVFSRKPKKPSQFLYQWDGSPALSWEKIQIDQPNLFIYQSDMDSSLSLFETPQDHYRFRFKIKWGNHIFGKEFFLDGEPFLWSGHRYCGIRMMTIFISVPTEYVAD